MPDWFAAGKRLFARFGTLAMLQRFCLSALLEVRMERLCLSYEVGWLDGWMGGLNLCRGAIPRKLYGMSVFIAIRKCMKKIRPPGDCPGGSRFRRSRHPWHRSQERVPCLTSAATQSTTCFFTAAGRIVKAAGSSTRSSQAPDISSVKS